MILKSMNKIIHRLFIIHLFRKRDTVTKMVENAKTVITTAGPFVKYGKSPSHPFDNQLLD